MAILPNVFNTNDHEGMGDFSPIPVGIYLAEIAKSELKNTRAKDGKYLSLQFKVLDGEFTGRLIFVNLNLVNPSQQAVDIAQNELKSICVACDIEGDLEDSFDLHNIPIGIKVGISAATAEWPAKNTIKKYIKNDDIDDTPF